MGIADKSQNVKQKQYYKKLNKDFFLKKVHIKNLYKKTECLIQGTKK